MANKKSNMVIPEYPSYRKDSKAAISLLGIVVIGAFVLIAVIFFMANRRVSNLERKLVARDSYELVLDKETGTMVLAVKEEITPQLRQKEYGRVAELYFENMYGFDKYTYEKHMERAVLLSGQVGVNQFSVYETEDIYSELLNEDLRLVATIDSTQIYEGDENGAKGFLFGKQRFIKPYGEGMYNFIVEFTVEDNGGRSDKNVHGAIVSGFDIKVREKVDISSSSKYD